MLTSIYCEGVNMMVVYLQKIIVSSIIANVVLENLSVTQKRDYHFTVEVCKP